MQKKYISVFVVSFVGNLTTPMMVDLTPQQKLQYIYHTNDLHCGSFMCNALIYTSRTAFRFHAVVTITGLVLANQINCKLQHKNLNNSYKITTNIHKAELNESRVV